jgi:hypothetical protein
MTTPHCFSYGSLMFREIMEAVADQRDLRNESSLKNHQAIDLIG